MKGVSLGLAASLLPATVLRAVAQEASPTAAGVDRAAVEAALPELVALAEGAVRDGDVPGLALAVVYQDEVVLAAGFGVRSTETDEPVGPDTVFQLASLSKPVASIVVSVIVGTGAATWDERVIDHRPAFRLADPWATRELTITDFLTHRSGLGGDAGGDLERIGHGRDAIFDRLRYLDLVSSPRSHYAYSNHRFILGGLTAAAAVDMTGEEASETLLYVDLEPPAPLTGATFVIGPDGLAQALILEYFEGNGQQLLPRVEED